MLPKTNSEKLCLHHVYCHRLFSNKLKKNIYLSCIVVNNEPTTDSLKVLMCPHCIVQFLENHKMYTSDVEYITT